MPPNLALKKKHQKADEVPFYGLPVARPGTRQVAEEPSPLVEAILHYLEAGR